MANLRCLICGVSIIQGQTQPRKYCSLACKQKAYRNTKKSKGFRVFHGYLIPVIKHAESLEGAESTCNTRTKPWYPMVNEKVGQF